MPKVHFQGQPPGAMLRVLRSVTDLVDEAKVTFTPGMMRMAVVDPAHVAMKVVELPMEGVTGEGSFGIDLDNLKALEELAQDSAASWHFDSGIVGESGRLSVRQANLEVEVKLVDTANMSEPKVPSLGPRTRFSTMAKNLQVGLRLANHITDHITLTVDAKGRVEVTGDSGNGSKTTAGIPANNVKVEEATRSLYSCDYLLNGLKCFLPEANVDVAYSSDYPCEFRGTIGFASIMFLMAPRIESV